MHCRARTRKDKGGLQVTHQVTISCAQYYSLNRIQSKRRAHNKQLVQFFFSRLIEQLVVEYNNLFRKRKKQNTKRNGKRERKKIDDARGATVSRVSLLETDRCRRSTSTSTCFGLFSFKRLSLLDTVSVSFVRQPRTVDPSVPFPSLLLQCRTAPLSQLPLNLKEEKEFIHSPCAVL